MPLRKPSARMTPSTTLLMELFGSQVTFINNLHNNFTIIMTFNYHHNLYSNYKTTTKSLNIQSSNNLITNTIF